MSDAYRTPGFVCPICPDAPLREYQGRYVCDACNGMLLRDDDFTAAVTEIDGVTAPLELADTRVSDKACPRCSRAMSWCTATVNHIRLAQPVLRCDQDGLWIGQAMLAGVFAKASRRMSALRTRIDGPGPYGPPTSGGVVSAMQSIHDAFGAGAPATAGLAIGNWSSARPRVHTLFVSAYKERRLGCPSCKEAALGYCGDRWACDACKGSFVENAALAAMIAEVTHEPWEMPVVEGSRGERACPVCSEAMLVEVLEAVTVDRCAAHGVWFDDHELASALIHAGTPQPRSVGGWLRRLFHRHGKIDA